MYLRVVMNSLRPMDSYMAIWLSLSQLHKQQKGLETKVVGFQYLGHQSGYFYPDFR